MCKRPRVGLVPICVYDVGCGYSYLRLGGYSMACLEVTTSGNDYGVLTPLF